MIEKDKELLNTFKRLDRVQQGASLAGMAALEETHDDIAMLQATNAYLVEHGHRPIRQNNTMTLRLKAAKTAFRNPEQVTVKYHVYRAQNDKLFTTPRDFDAEYAEIGFCIDHDALCEELMDVRNEGFALNGGLKAISAYLAGRAGLPIEYAIPWIKGLEQAEGGDEE